MISPFACRQPKFSASALPPFSFVKSRDALVAAEMLSDAALVCVVGRAVVDDDDLEIRDSPTRAGFRSFARSLFLH